MKLSVAVMLLLNLHLRAFAGTIVTEGPSVVLWKPGDGREVRFVIPELVQDGMPLTVELKNRSVHGNAAAFEYALSDGTVNVKIEADKNTLVAQMTVVFDKPVMANLETAIAFDVAGEPAHRIGLPERNGVFKIWPMSPDAGGAGKFELGLGANGSIQCSRLGMPVVGLIFGETESQMAVAADPYCGSVISAQGQRIMIRTTYSGALVPIKHEKRTVALEIHHGGADGTCRAFYRTIPEIQPGAPWTQGIHLVYYDYLSDKGRGWFKELQVLADRIPEKYRGNVAVCLHGWYDYFQKYAYDQQNGTLLKEWTAFPGTRKIPMSLADMHRRMKFAKDLGFRVLLYFADGTNSDSGAPEFHEEYVLKDKGGKTFRGWKGPDSLGQPLMMDPSVSGLRDWYHAYMKALLAEYGKDVDGFVWDETFYINVNFISYPDGKPAYADRAMMSLVSELTQLVQDYRKENPDLVFLASDLGRTSYALVANGTYQDSAMTESAWGPSMFANYRNCLWSCNWFPLRHAQGNAIAAENYGLPQGVSDGWGDNCGPSRMPPELLDAVLERFMKNVVSKRERLRLLKPQD